VLCVVYNMSILYGFTLVSKNKPQIHVDEEQIGKCNAQVSFNRDCQRDPPLYGVGGMIYPEEHHVISFKVGLIWEIYNLYKLMVLKHLLIYLVGKGGQKITNNLQFNSCSKLDKLNKFLVKL